MRKLAISLLCIFTLLSCSRAPSLLVLLDPYSRELLRARGTEAAGLSRALSGRFRTSIELVDPAKEPQNTVERLLRERRPSWAYLSPLLPVDAHSLAVRFPAVRFVQEAARPALEPNLVTLIFDRGEAFGRAGTAVARLLTRPALQAVLGSAVQGRQPKAGLVLAFPLERARREAEAFRASFAAEADPSLLLERDIGSLTDTAKARRILEKLREEGVALFVLKTYTLTGFCLEFLRSQGGLAVLEEPEGSLAYSDQVLFFLSEDFVGALLNLQLNPESPSIAGPVLLIPGGASRALPAGALQELGITGAVHD